MERDARALRERLLQMEDHGALIRRFNCLKHSGRILIRPLVPAGVERCIELLRRLGEDVLRKGALHTVLDVCRGDGRSVFVLHAFLEGERPAEAVVGDFAGVRGEVRDHRWRLARRFLGHGQRAVVELANVGSLDVVAVARIQGLEVRGHQDIEVAAFAAEA